MSNTKYTYSISQDFPNEAVATDRLTQEIQDSAIVIALDYINTDGDDCDIWFKDVLSGGDQSTLSTLVANHNGQPLAPDPTDVNIKTTDIDVPTISKGFHDLTGHNFYKTGKRFLCEPGKDNCFMEKFASNIYLTGGGYKIPEKVYQEGVEVLQKPEDGDTVCFDFADVDNVLGYGKTANISKVARASNVVTITTDGDHTFVVDDPVCIDCNDDAFDIMEGVVVAVPSSSTFTVAQTGDDVSEKGATGTIGKIVVLGTFVYEDPLWSGMHWELLTADAKLIPAGVYLRYHYHSVSTVSNDVVSCVWYNMRSV